MADSAFVSVDLDSTLADTRHRHGLIHPDGKSTDWRAYSMACADDAPITPVVRMVQALAKVYPIAIVSGRDNAARSLTNDWLARHAVPYDLLLLDDHARHFTTHEDYKIARIQDAEQALRRLHLFHVDDWPPVALALRAAGLQCVTVTPPRVVDDFNPDGHLTFV
jgi:hypothetical protein